MSTQTVRVDETPTQKHNRQFVAWALENGRDASLESAQDYCNETNLKDLHEAIYQSALAKTRVLLLASAEKANHVN